MDEIQVLIADDHPIFRVGLAGVFRAGTRIRLIGQAENGREALDLILSLKPDVAVLDIEMPEMNGLEVCAAVRQAGAATKTIILTLYKEYALYQKALEVGATGYLLKDNAVEELFEAIEAVHAGRPYASRGLELKPAPDKSPQDAALHALLQRLTKTEQNIILLIAEHLTTKEIAKKLFVSEKTVENHRYNIAKKLELDRGQNSLLIFALEHSKRMG